MDEYGLRGSLLKKIQVDKTLKIKKYNSDIEFDFLSNLFVEFDGKDYDLCATIRGGEESFEI